ncbi:NBR1-Ig-like domain-containing protein [Microbacterium testaceum]|uniref:NBR1-Ig-like domain-containing protein n=1 Tax=Microbacterium testaceum TaxID=2033 RepID=UPI002AC649A9|nr:NBR1-Ig-like domain-containing protein [Microbacterium testaceum]MDZ5144941.1 NBR1-Ig-like domain-containing protein [Microbacterium testaceum]
MCRLSLAAAPAVSGILQAARFVVYLYQFLGVDMARPEEALPPPVTASQRFGQVLRGLRHDAGFASTADLVSATGLARSTLTHFERGRRAPSKLSVLALERALNARGILFALWEDIQFEKHERVRFGGLGNIRSLDGDRSVFIADVTIPDNTIMKPLQRFDKTWRIRNAGSVAWTGRYLRRLGARAGVNLITTPELTPIPDTSPGEVVDITVPCVAQFLEGSSRANLKMSRSDGSYYFPDKYAQGLIVAVLVQA